MSHPKTRYLALDYLAPITSACAAEVAASRAHALTLMFIRLSIPQIRQTSCGALATGACFSIVSEEQGRVW
jgi:hypothetical protein